MQRDFTCAPLKEQGEYKPVSAVPGITPAMAAALTKAGYTKAVHLVGQYLVTDMHEQVFKEWLNDLLGNGVWHLDYCYQAVKEWVENNM